MLEPEKQRCPWCPNPEGCNSCSLTGTDPDNYKLVPQSMVNAQLRAERRRWLFIVVALLGMFLASLFVLAFALWTQNLA